jgi:hypothetical protein
MRLERPRHRLLLLVLLGVVLALLLGAVNVEMAAVRPAWNAAVPGSVIVFGRPAQAGGPVQPRVIMCMLYRLFNTTGRPGRPSAEGTRSRS